MALLLEYSWAVAALLLLLIILLFPDGRVPSPRWRPILWSYLAQVVSRALEPAHLSVWVSHHD